MKRVFSQRGGSMVEFALILPILIILLFGIIEFGFYLYNWQVLTNAAREGARRGIVQETPRVSATVIEQTVHDYADDHLITLGAHTPLSFSSPPVPCTNFGDNLTVSVRYDYSFLIIPNFLGIGKSLPVRSVSVMKCE